VDESTVAIEASLQEQSMPVGVPPNELLSRRTLIWQGQAARRRARHAREGLTVPPISIFSITNGCW